MLAYLLCRFPQTLEQYCQEYVLPLAGDPVCDSFDARQGCELHLLVLGSMLPIRLKNAQIFRHSATMSVIGADIQYLNDTGEGPTLTLVLQGQHYQALFTHGGD